MIHIAERDTQVSRKPKKVGEFVNTWSIDGFVSEGSQPAEMGWGTHEKGLPPDGARHEFGCDAAIYLNRPGLITRVRTWTPLEGPFHGFIITHNESISIADYFTLRQGQHVVYRPTVHYAYHPCDQAIMSMHECAGKNLHQQKKQRLIVDEITDGRDELGVLLMGHQKGAYWYGSQLDIHETRELTPYNNATSIQVCAPVLSGIIWALENPDRGIVEADEMDFDRNLEICMPYLGPVVGKYSDWTPLKDRDGLFPEDLDQDRSLAVQELPGDLNYSALVAPAASLQVQAVAAVEFDAFLFQQASLENVAAVAGQAVGHLALGVDDTVPRDLGCRVEALKDTANKAGAPRHAGHRSDLAIGRNPAPRDAADDGANCFDCFIALEVGSLMQLALRRHRQLASIPGCPALQQSGRC